MLVEELHQVRAELERFAEAIAVAGDVSVLVKAVTDREQRRVRLQHELAILTAKKTGIVDAGTIEHRLREKLTDWRATLLRQTPLTLQLLLKLIEGKLTFVPNREDRTYSFEGKATLGNLLSGLIPSAELRPYGWRARGDLSKAVTVQGVVKAA